MTLSQFQHSNLTEYESKQVLREHDIPTVEEDRAESPEEAQAIAEQIGAPVIMKIDSRDIHHKTEAGGVQRVERVDDVADAYKDMIETVKKHSPDATIEGILVEEVLDGNEFIIGVNTDPQFGKVLMFGLGGIYVEVFRDVSFRTIPVTEYDIRTMLDDIEAKTLLDGVRGQEPADRDRLTEILQQVSSMVDSNPRIRELDINPLFINGSEIKAADALITLGDTDE
ncbi:MAG: acetate--CoA ligase family protein [Candidatus Nanohaloarchaea archaeon]|nr:acetate--CoA ligase family protein [Candidatus Nanohaloarchaea archaeon]